MQSGAGWETLLSPMLAETGIAAPIATIRPLTGGVSSDIVAVELEDGTTLCAKRALEKLRVASDWEAPVVRNRFEVAYLRRAAAIAPGAVPRVIAEDRANGIALLTFLAPDRHVLWKSELLGGRVDPSVAERVGDLLGRIHAATFNDAPTAREFSTDALFEALRLDPYLVTLTLRFPELTSPIGKILAATRAHKQALVHGDVSPKNILIRQEDRMPVLLDAECAWYGDPAFDAAFAINHLALKAVHMPTLRAELKAAALRLFSAWIARLPAPEQGPLAARVAALLPCLLLARVDGKSPVEYLDESGRERVRAIALPMITRPPAVLEDVLARL